jgi:hypothetical protein
MSYCNHTPGALSIDDYVEISPECPFKTGYCEFRMKLSLADPELAFVCKGMRAWVTKSN